jgi:hypothetical protein
MALTYVQPHDGSKSEEVYQPSKFASSRVYSRDRRGVTQTNAYSRQSSRDRSRPKREARSTSQERPNSKTRRTDSGLPHRPRDRSRDSRNRSQDGRRARSPAGLPQARAPATAAIIVPPASAAPAASTAPTAATIFSETAPESADSTKPSGNALPLGAGPGLRKKGKGDRATTSPTTVERKVPEEPRALSRSRSRSRSRSHSRDRRARRQSKSLALDGQPVTSAMSEESEHRHITSATSDSGTAHPSGRNVAQTRHARENKVSCMHDIYVAACQALGTPVLTSGQPASWAIPEPRRQAAYSHAVNTHSHRLLSPIDELVPAIEFLLDATGPKAREAAVEPLSSIKWAMASPVEREAYLEDRRVDYVSCVLVAACIALAEAGYAEHRAQQTLSQHRASRQAELLAFKDKMVFVLSSGSRRFL